MRKIQNFSRIFGQASCQQIKFLSCLIRATKEKIFLRIKLNTRLAKMF